MFLQHVLNVEFCYEPVAYFYAKCACESVKCRPFLHANLYHVGYFYMYCFRHLCPYNFWELRRMRLAANTITIASWFQSPVYLPHQGAVMRTSDVLFVINLNMLLYQQPSWHRFESYESSMMVIWFHCNRSCIASAVHASIPRPVMLVLTSTTTYF